MEVGWTYHEDFVRHVTQPDHPEGVHRLHTILGALRDSKLDQRLTPLDFAPATIEQVHVVHDPVYVELVKVACEQGAPWIGAQDTHICDHSYRSALTAAGAVIGACDAVMAKTVGRAFCPVRPPGHHAEHDLAKGFCLFNNIAIAAEHLLAAHELKRVAIVDFDVHHGNGSQHTFEHRDDVLVVSIHEHPHFLFPHTGFEHETGNRKGSGYTINLPMLPGDGDGAYRKAFSETIMPKLEAFDPQFVLVSAGFDAVAEDPLADICLSVDSYAWMTGELTALADRLCEGRLVSVLEGGYDPDSLRRSTIIHVEGLMGKR